MNDKIVNWKENDDTFIKTQAYWEVLKQINSNGCVAVTGGFGSGKRTIVHMVSLLLSKKYGFQITLVSNAADFKTYNKPGRKTLFVLEDFCGKFTANSRLVEEWCEILDIVKLAIETGVCKILFSCRLQVYRDEQFNCLTPFQSCECNITSDELSLTIDEKEQFLKKYMRLENIEKDILRCKIDFFPRLCGSYSQEKNGLDIEKYLNMQYDVYLLELTELKRKGKIKFCGLCLCIMFNNQLTENHLCTASNEFKVIVQETCSYCELNTGTSLISIGKELDTLDKTYINKHDGMYEVFQGKVFDYLAFYFGQEFTQCFIDHADSAFLRERFLWKSEFVTQDPSIENTIPLRDDKLTSYINKMNLNWTNGKVLDVFHNINMGNRLFRNKFLESLKKIDDEQATKLAIMKDVSNEDTASGKTPLIISCIHGYDDLLQWLIEKGANVNDRLADNCSALYMACEKKKVEIVKVLLKNNADVNLCSDKGNSPLGIACYSHEELAIINLLIEKKANVNARLADYCSVLYMACEKKKVDVVKLLLKNKAKVNVCSAEGISPLGIACYSHGDLDIIKELLKGKANVNEHRLKKNNMTPLYMACKQNYLSVATALLNHKADPSICLKNGMSPLLVACMNKNTKLVRLLLENSANPNVDLNYGNTPLFTASAMGLEDITELLLDKNALINKSVHSKEKIMKAYKGRPTYLDKVKKSWVSVAESYGSNETNDYLRDNKSPEFIFDVVTDSTPIHIACFMGQFKILKLLTKHNTCINKEKENGITPLYYACAIGRIDIIKTLMEEGADPGKVGYRELSQFTIENPQKLFRIHEILSNKGTKSALT